MGRLFVIFAAILLASVFASPAAADERDDWRAFRAAQIAQLRAEREFGQAAGAGFAPVAHDEHWTKADSPKRIEGNYFLAPGKTLTIEPGVEVLVDNGARFDIYGALLIAGTAQEPVVFRFTGTPPKSEPRHDLAHSVNFYDKGRGEIHHTKFFNGSKVSVFTNEPFVMEHSEFYDFTEGDLVLFQDLKDKTNALRLNDNVITHGNVPKRISGLQIFSENIVGAEVSRNKLIWSQPLKDVGGIHFWYPIKNVSIADNTIETKSSEGDDWRGNIFGISLWDKLDNVSVARNALTGTGKTQKTNIILWDAAVPSTKIEKNTVKGARSGLELWYAGSPTVERNLLDGNDIGILIDRDPPNLLRNKITNNRIGVIVFPQSPTVAINGQGNTISGSGEHGVFNRNIDKTIKINNNWWGDASGPSGEGYVGTGDKVSHGVKVDNWLSHSPLPIVLVPGLGMSFHAGLLANPNDKKAELTGWRFMPGVNYYDGLIEALKAVGYGQSDDLLVAHYDWRLPAADAARLYLKPTIDKAKELSGDGKVDVIGHSLGGIVSRAYIQGSGYDNDVNALIMLGTPNQGAAKAYPVWGGGEVPTDWWMVRPYIWYLKKINSPVFPGLLDDFYIIRTFMRGVKDLLPVYDYLKINKVDEFIPENEMFERNLFLHFNNSQKPKTDLFSIVGSGKNSQKLVDITKRGDGKTPWPDGQALSIKKQPTSNFTDGDGTIPKAVATFGKETKTYEVTSSHQQLPSKAIPAVFEILENLHPEGNFDIFVPNKVMQFAFASPVKVSVIAPNGNRYDQLELGDMKLVTIPDPTDGEYKLELTGTDNGQYHTLAAYDDMANEQSVVKELAPQPIKKDEVVKYSAKLDSKNGSLNIQKTSGGRVKHCVQMNIAGRTINICVWQH